MQTTGKFISLLILMLLVPGCEAIGDIFKAGVWFGIIIVIAVVALILLIVKMIKG